MTISEVKSILISARKAAQKYQLAKDDTAAYRLRLSSGKSVRYGNDGAVHERDGNSVELAYCKLAELEAKSDRLLGKMYRCRCKAEKLIASVPDDVQREVLTRRYIIGQRWEDIAYVMSYSYRHVLRLHGWALAAISERCH